MARHWFSEVQVAEHEAAHAIAAQKMGLPVAWVSIEPGCDEGINFLAAVKIPDEEIDMERDLFAVCVAMAAPYHINSHRSNTKLSRYMQMEYQLALECAGRGGITAEEVYDRSSEIVSEHWGEIVDLAVRLQDEGKVVFATTA